MSLGPAPVLALLVGVLHVSIYVLIRGSAGRRLFWLVLASVLGAWAGDALGSRIGLELLRVGDFHLVSASVLAWVGILGVAVIAILGPRPIARAPSGSTPIPSSRLTRRRTRWPVVEPGRQEPDGSASDDSGTHDPSKVSA